MNTNKALEIQNEQLSHNDNEYFAETVKDYISTVVESIYDWKDIIEERLNDSLYISKQMKEELISYQSNEVLEGYIKYNCEKIESYLQKCQKDLKDLSQILQRL